MNLIVLLLFSVVWSLACSQELLYDSYFGKPITSNRRDYLSSVVNGTSLCTFLVLPCTEDEGRRLDGTCTNPKFPSRGAIMTPMPRLLPPQFGAGNGLRPARDGSELPSARFIRTTLLADGYVRDHEFSTLATHFMTVTVGDTADLRYILRYARGSDCCVGNRPNRVNPLCIPIPVPEDDPYLRRAGIRCLNLTRVEHYQDYGCLPPTLPEERINRVTPLLDLSLIYGNTEARSRTVRANQGGFLAFRMEGNREVPLGQSPFCIENRPPAEASCYGHGDDFHSNLVPGTYLGAMWLFREHNRIARHLAIINPCWDDDKIFRTAREINIAEYQFIFYYELIAELLGRKNALAEGIIYDTADYVNDFDPRYMPGTYREYTEGTRWFHTSLPGRLDLYRNGKYGGSRAQVTDALRSGILAVNNTEADLTEGSFIQPADKLDQVIDPDFGERYAGEALAASDLPATDMMRGRDAGFPPYNHYRKICGLPVAKKWSDFHDTIDKDKVEVLSRIYDDVDDMELMVAIYVERLLPDAAVGPTLYCLMVQNLAHWRRADKFFFEHGGFPAALTIPQLNEVKKTSIARILCDNGDQVKKIQPRAMLRIRPWNPVVPCDEIPAVDLNQWFDPLCPVPKE